MLVLLYSSRGSKFVTLRHELGISRDSLNRTLSHLITLQLVRKNTGHGHPLRPEYLPTTEGMVVAKNCTQLVVPQISERWAEVIGHKWSLPILATLREDSMRFSSLRRELGSITPRALTTALKSLETGGLVARIVYADTPPTVLYELKPKALPLSRRARKLGTLLCSSSRNIGT